MSKVYEQNGCMPMDTPLIEKEEILLAKSGKFIELIKKKISRH